MFHKCYPVLDIQFDKNIMKMILYGSFADKQLFGNFPVAQSFDNQLHQLDFAAA